LQEALQQYPKALDDAYTAGTIAHVFNGIIYELNQPAIVHGLQLADLCYGKQTCKTPTFIS